MRMSDISRRTSAFCAQAHGRPFKQSSSPANPSVKGRQLNAVMAEISRFAGRAALGRMREIL